MKGGRVSQQDLASASGSVMAAVSTSLANRCADVSPLPPSLKQASYDGRVSLGYLGLIGGGSSSSVRSLIYCLATARCEKSAANKCPYSYLGKLFFACFASRSTGS